MWYVNQRSACSTGRALLVSAMDGSSRSTTASSSPMTISSRRSGLIPAIPPEWKAHGFDHIGDIDVEGGVLLRRARATRLLARPPGDADLRPRTRSPTPVVTTSRSTTTRSSPSIPTQAHCVLDGRVRRTSAAPVRHPSRLATAAGAPDVDDRGPRPRRRSSPRRRLALDRRHDRRRLSRRPPHRRSAIRSARSATSTGKVKASTRPDPQRRSPRAQCRRQHRPDASHRPEGDSSPVRSRVSHGFSVPRSVPPARSATAARACERSSADGPRRSTR